MLLMSSHLCRSNVQNAVLDIVLSTNIEDNTFSSVFLRFQLSVHWKRKKTEEKV